MPCLAFGRDDTADVVTGEDLLFVDVPSVLVSATRRTQGAAEAPVTVFVVDRQKIAMSGATTIADVLRMVPGVDVVTLTARNQSVGIRGLLLNAYSSKLLVMIDGRTVYWDMLGAILWEGLPVGLEEIERIEVVRSPVSSYYGPSGVAGVINIITRAADAIGGVECALTVGDNRTIIGHGQFGAARGRLDLKGSMGYDKTNEWEGESRSAGTLTLGNGRIGMQVGDGGHLSLSAGRTKSKGIRFFADEYIGPVTIEGVDDYAQLDGSGRGILGHLYVHQKRAQLRSDRLSQTDTWRVTMLDADAQQTVHPASWLTLIYGGNYRLSNIEQNLLIPESHWQNAGGVFWMAPRPRVLACASMPVCGSTTIRRQHSACRRGVAFR